LTWLSACAPPAAFRLAWCCLAHPLPVGNTLEALTAAKIRPAAYASAEGSGARFTETVVVIKA